MVEAKTIMLIIADVFGWTSVVLGIASNFENIKSVILFILATIYLMLRIYFYFIKQRQEVMDKHMDLEDKREARNRKKTG